MRFLMLNWRDPENPLSGGAERVSLAYLAELARRGHEVYWFANDFPAASPQSEVSGIKIIRGGDKGTSVLKARAWHHAQKKFDLVIDQHHGIPWYAPWWCGTNCVAYIHEVLGPIWKSFYGWPLSSIGQWQERWTHWAYRNVPFWTPSNCTKDLLKEHGVKDVHVFFNGTDATPLIELEPKPLQLPLRLIAVSRLAPNKRVDHVIRSLEVIRQQGIDARLTVVGWGEVENVLKQLAKELGVADAVEFTGLLNEQQKNDRLRAAHFLIHTSVREGWGLNVIEANAMGTPAIVYPVGGLVDSTLHDETGIVTREESPESVARAVAEIMKSPEKYSRLRVNAWNRAKSLQWSQALPPVCDWLESLAAGKKL
ncbi:MAG TPA: glycosyltransferase family 4 protein [Verrucomicrobiae bacterium]|jgi:glycosyltransferase involved in cell wall biosynthesis